MNIECTGLLFTTIVAVYPSKIDPQIIPSPPTLILTQFCNSSKVVWHTFALKLNSVPLMSKCPLYCYQWNVVPYLPIWSIIMKLITASLFYLDIESLILSIINQIDMSKLDRIINHKAIIIFSFINFSFDNVINLFCKVNQR